MQKPVEFYQLVAVVGYGSTWNIPRVWHGDRWCNIENAHLVENLNHFNGHDRYEKSIFRIKRIMEERGWNIEISDTKQPCHEHLYYQHYRLRCWK